MRHPTFHPFVAALVLVAGCQTPRPIAPPEPPLTLLSAGALALPGDCIASGPFTVTFTVASSGQTRDVRALDAPSCIDRALTAWVESFRYEPPARATPTKIEWMLVTGKRETSGG